MKARLTVAVICIPLLFIILFFLPPVYLTVFTAVICAVGVYEFLGAAGLRQNSRIVLYALLFSLFIPFRSFFHLSYGPFGLALFALVCLVSLEAILAFEMGKKVDLVSLLSVFAAMLIPLALSGLVRLRLMENGEYYVLIPIIIAFVSDAAAMLCGAMFGQNKLSPKVSPKKTVEGSAGGVAGAALSLIAYGLVLQHFADFSVNYSFLIIYGVLGSLISQLGDLAFSLIKRERGIKDYGNLLPGHGGILDRFDSVIFVLPLVELLLIWFPAF